MAATARALELNPAYVDAMNWRQIAAGNYGDYETARDILRRIIDVDPLSIVGRMNYANVLALTDLEAARTMGRSLMEQSPWASYTSLGLIEYFSGDGVAASLGWTMRAYGQDPHDELSNRALIRILSQVNLFAEARRISDGNLQIVDVAENQLESAIYSLEPAHAGDPENMAPLQDLADASTDRPCPQCAWPMPSNWPVTPKPLGRPWPFIAWMLKGAGSLARCTSATCWLKLPRAPWKGMP
jgi:tetratricopeptide (TPR) repeat protein